MFRRKWYRRLGYYILFPALLAACQERSGKRSEEKQPDLQKKEAVSTTIEGEPAVQLGRVMNEALDSIKLAQYTKDANKDFVQIMQKHQKAALEMYRVMTTNSKNEELKMLARTMAEKVQNEGVFLSGVTHNAVERDTSDFSARAVDLLDSLTRNGFSMHGSILDLDFSTMMRQHHFLAIELARLYQRKGSDAVLLSFSKRLITSYRRDMDVLSDWKRKNYPDVH